MRGSLLNRSVPPRTARLGAGSAQAIRSPGSGFKDAIAVYFGTNGALETRVISDSSIKAVIRAASESGPVDVTVVMKDATTRSQPNRPADLFTYGSVVWTKVDGPHTPGGGNIAYDPGDRVAVYWHHGSAPAAGEQSETWTWDGTRWTKLSLSVSPRMYVPLGMVYDGTRHEVVLVGADSLDPTGTSAQTWVWSRGHWTQRQSATPPRCRSMVRRLRAMPRPVWTSSSGERPEDRQTRHGNGTAPTGLNGTRRMFRR